MSSIAFRPFLLVATLATLAGCAAQQDDASNDPSTSEGEDELSGGADIVFRSNGTVALPASVKVGQKLKIRRMNGRPQPCGAFGIGEDFWVAGYTADGKSKDVSLSSGPAHAEASLYKEGTMTVPHASHIGVYLFVRVAVGGKDYCYDSNHGANYTIPVRH